MTYETKDLGICVNEDGLFVDKIESSINLRNKESSGLPFGLGRIVRNSSLIAAGLALAFTSCAGENKCGCVGSQPYDLARKQISIPGQFEHTPYVYRLKGKNDTTYIYRSTDDIEIFKVDKNSTKIENIIGIGYGKGKIFDKDYEKIYVYKEGMAIVYEKENGKWTKVCSELEEFKFKDSPLGFYFSSLYSGPKPFFGFEKEKVSDEEIQKFLDLIEELKDKFPK